MSAEAPPPSDPTAVRCRRWRGGRLECDQAGLPDVADWLSDPEALVWIDLPRRHHPRLAELARALALDPHAVEDAIASDERAKATGYDGYAFVSSYATAFDGARLRAHRVSAFVLDRVLVTVHGPGFEGVADITRRWDEDPAALRGAGVDALLYGLLDSLVDGQFETVQALDAAIESFEDALFDEHPQGRQEQRRVYQVRRASVQFRRLVVPTTQLADTLHRLRGARHPELAASWNDLYDHVARVVEWSDSLRDQLNNVFAANMALQDSRLNLVMRKLTAWAAIIAVPTAVTGFYGQNVPYPGFSQHWGFYISTSVLIGSMVALYVVFKRKRWL